MKPATAKPIFVVMINNGEKYEDEQESPLFALTDEKKAKTACERIEKFINKNRKRGKYGTFNDLPEDKDPPYNISLLELDAIISCCEEPYCYVSYINLYDGLNIR